jgi:hypothetical protein
LLDQAHDQGVDAGILFRSPCLEFGQSDVVETSDTETGHDVTNARKTPASNAITLDAPQRAEALAYRSSPIGAEKVARHGPI